MVAVRPTRWSVTIGSNMFFFYQLHLFPFLQGKLFVLFKPIVMVMVGKPIHKFCMRSAFISVARISTGFSYIFFLKGSWSSHFSLNISPGIIQISSVREARTLHRQVEKVSLFFSCAGSIASFYFYFFFRNNKFPSHGETHSILFCVLFHNEKKTESHQLISPFTCNASQQQQVCVCARAPRRFTQLFSDGVL